MINNCTENYSLQHKLSGWLVHLFTASGAVLGLFTLFMIFNGEFITAFWLMTATIVIDSVDGTLARSLHVKTVVPQIDGALLDNIVDYLNYVITPAFLLLASDILPPFWKLIGAGIIVLASAYQFTQTEAKTEDNFFLGFPSYWNLVVFYLFISHLNPWANLSIIITLGILVFIPIKYVYLTRLDHVTNHRFLKLLLILATIIYAGATITLLSLYPDKSIICNIISWGFAFIYVAISLYRTFVPMRQNTQIK